jgi:hypothetical protein
MTYTANISTVSSPPPIRDRAAYAAAVADNAPTRRPNQATRVLNVLRQRADQGLLSPEFVLAPPDGGPQIFAIAPRILELRRAGWTITTTIEEPSRLARYVLHEQN